MANQNYDFLAESAIPVFDLDTVDLDNGIHLLVIQAVDQEGNVSDYSDYAVYDNGIVRYTIKRSTLVAIANSIRARTGSRDPIPGSEIAREIRKILNGESDFDGKIGNDGDGDMIYTIDASTMSDIADSIRERTQSTEPVKGDCFSTSIDEAVVTAPKPVVYLEGDKLVINTGNSSLEAHVVLSNWNFPEYVFEYTYFGDKIEVDLSSFELPRGRYYISVTLHGTGYVTSETSEASGYYNVYPGPPLMAPAITLHGNILTLIHDNKPTIRYGENDEWAFFLYIYFDKIHTTRHKVTKLDDGSYKKGEEISKDNLLRDMAVIENAFTDTGEQVYQAVINESQTLYCDSPMFDLYKVEYKGQGVFHKTETLLDKATLTDIQLVSNGSTTTGELVYSANNGSVFYCEVPIITSTYTFKLIKEGIQILDLSDYVGNPLGEHYKVHVQVVNNGYQPSPKSNIVEYYSSDLKSLRSATISLTGDWLYIDDLDENCSSVTVYVTNTMYHDHYTHTLTKSQLDEDSRFGLSTLNASQGSYEVKVIVYGEGHVASQPSNVLEWENTVAPMLQSPTITLTNATLTIADIDPKATSLSLIFTHAVTIDGWVTEEYTSYEYESIPENYTLDLSTFDLPVGDHQVFVTVHGIGRRDSQSKRVVYSIRELEKPVIVADGSKIIIEYYDLHASQGTLYVTHISDPKRSITHDFALYGTHSIDLADFRPHKGVYKVCLETFGPGQIGRPISTNVLFMVEKEPKLSTPTIFISGSVVTVSDIDPDASFVWVYCKHIKRNQLFGYMLSGAGEIDLSEKAAENSMWSGDYQVYAIAEHIDGYFSESDKSAELSYSIPLWTPKLEQIDARLRISNFDPHAEKVWLYLIHKSDNKQYTVDLRVLPDGSLSMIHPAKVLLYDGKYDVRAFVEADGYTSSAYSNTLSVAIAENTDFLTWLARGFVYILSILPPWPDEDII